MTAKKSPGRRGRLPGAAAAAVLAAGLAPVGPAQAQDDDTDRLMIAYDQELDTFNPFKQQFVISYNLSLLAYDTLIRTDAESFAPSPGLATEWEESDDGLTWTFTIREGAEWSDGEPLTAEDVEYTYDLLIENEDIRDWNIDFAGNLVDAEAPDDTTFVLTLEEPAPNDILYGGTYIVPEHIWSGFDDPADPTANDALPIVGSGPFQTVEYQINEFIRLEANPGYWDGAPGFDEIVYVVYSEPDAAVAALEAGEVDIVSKLNPAQAEALENADHVTVNNAQNRRFTSLNINHRAATADGDGFGDGHPALRDQAVRTALHTAIDKEALVDRVLDGSGDPGVGIMPEIFTDYHWDGGGDLVEFDIAEANGILDEAGYEKGPDGIRTMPDGGEKLTFRLYHHADNTDYATVVSFLTEWWEELGLEIEPEPIEMGTLNDKAYLGEYDIVFSGWGVGPNPSEIMGMYTCAVLPTKTDGTERSHENYFCDEEYDRLQAEQKLVADAAERRPMVERQQEILYDHAGTIWLYYQNNIEAYNSDKVANLTPQPADGGMITGQQGFLWAYHSATPVEGSEGSGATAASDNPTATILIAAAAAVVIGAGAFLIARRRRATADERE
ncbi:ABC transporter substrate-binding protein [Salininema proteolyticum]|uniref:ABC transporter substrate-binding protein n=1 Tax=Salininema proteolyticum TaxID=1607685 RepID=A0ABV8U3W0_9ACTN